MNFFMIVITAVGTGAGILHLCRISVKTVDEFILYALMPGLCACSGMSLLFGSFSVEAAHWVLLCSTAASLGGLLYTFPQWRSVCFSWFSSSRTLHWSWWSGVCFAAIVLSLGCALIDALAPITHWDACVAHLTLPAHYAREGYMGVYAGNEYSGYPQLMHSLFTLAFYKGSEHCVTFISWSWAVLALLALYRLGKILSSPLAGLIAAAMLATTPIFNDQAGVPSLDLAFTALTLAAITALFQWRDSGRQGWLYMAAMLAGSSCGVRHTGYLTCVLLTLGAWGGALPGKRIGSFFLFSIAGILAASPWLIRSAVLLGNPVFPFLTGLFHTTAIPHFNITGVGKGTHTSVTDLGLGSFLLFPWDILMHPDKYDGWNKSPGPWLIALGIPALVIGSNRVRWLGAFSWIGFSCFYPFQRLARYLLPFIAPMIAAAGVAAAVAVSLVPVSEGDAKPSGVHVWSRRLILALLAVSFGYGIMLQAASVHFKWKAALGIENRDTYLATRVERYTAFQWVNEHIDPRDMVMTLDPRGYFLKGRSYQNHEPLKGLHDKSPEEVAHWFLQNDLKYLFFPVNYLNESPGIRTNWLPMVNEWLKDSAHFKLIKTIDDPSPRSGKPDVVEVYQLCP